MEINWNHLPGTLNPDLVLLSDVNYQPADFDNLYGVVNTLLAKSASILLCTPHRLSAIPFVDKILPFVTFREERNIIQNNQQVALTIFMLQRNQSDA